MYMQGEIKQTSTSVWSQDSAQTQTCSR